MRGGQDDLGIDSQRFGQVLPVRYDGFRAVYDGPFLVFIINQALDSVIAPRTHRQNQAGCHEICGFVQVQKTNDQRRASPYLYSSLMRP